MKCGPSKSRETRRARDADGVMSGGDSVGAFTHDMNGGSLCAARCAGSLKSARMKNQVDKWTGYMTTPGKFCHKCPHDGKGNDECLNCRGFAEIVKGANGTGDVSFDAGCEAFLPREHEHAEIRFHDEPLPEPTELLQGVPEPIVEKLVCFMRTWLTISPAARDVISRRMTGDTLREIGAARNTSGQASHKLVRQALQRCPALGAVVGGCPPALVSPTAPTQRAGTRCPPKLA
jgi:hypothetical protein